MVRNEKMQNYCFKESQEGKGDEPVILYHASKEIVEFPEVRKTRYTKDFSWGFY